MIHRQLSLDAFSAITDRTMTALELDDLVILLCSQAILLHDVIGVVVVPATLYLGAVVTHAARSRMRSLAVRRDSVRYTIYASLLFTSSHLPPKDQQKVDSVLGCP